MVSPFAQSPASIKLADALRQEGLSKYEIEQMYMMYPYLVPQTD